MVRDYMTFEVAVPILRSDRFLLTTQFAYSLVNCYQSTILRRSLGRRSMEELSEEVFRRTRFHQLFQLCRCVFLREFRLSFSNVFSVNFYHCSFFRNSIVSNAWHWFRTEYNKSYPDSGMNDNSQFSKWSLHFADYEYWYLLFDSTTK